MVKFTHNRVVKLTVMIAFAIVTVSCLVAFVGMRMIVENETHRIGQSVEKLTQERYAYYQHHENIHVGSLSWVHEENKSSIVQIVGTGAYDDVTMEVYFDLEQVDLKQPIETIIPKLNRIMEEDTEGLILKFCHSHEINVKADSIASLSAETFAELISTLQENTGVDR